MKKGFTLVELSIVLVIIGLLIGGILSAQSMIETSRINKLGREMGQYKMIAKNFEETFGALPGDGAPSFSTYCSSANGAQNGLIGHYSSTSDGCNGGEYGYFWTDLNYAGFLPGAYVGGYSPGIYPNYAPIISYFKAYNNMSYPGFMAGNARSGQNVPDDNPLYGRSGSFIETSSSWWGAGFLTPIQAFTVDKKFDDGMPGTGTMTASVFYPNFNTYCVNGAIDAAGSTITWNTTQTANFCKVQLWLDD